MMQTQKFKINDMHCVSCAMNIDMELEDADGVTESSTNYAKHESDVKFDNEKTSSDKIIEAIKKTGYTASVI